MKREIIQELGQDKVQGNQLTVLLEMSFQAEVCQWVGRTKQRCLGHAIYLEQKG